LATGTRTQTRRVRDEHEKRWHGRMELLPAERRGEALVGDVRVKEVVYHRRQTRQGRGGMTGRGGAGRRPWR
jgi:hypothetical protein